MVIFAEKSNMNTVTINSKLYNSTELYAKKHKMTIEEVVESGLRLLLNSFGTKQNKVKTIWETGEYKNASAYLDSLVDDGGKPIPAGDDGRDARTEKYAS